MNIYEYECLNLIVAEVAIRHVEDVITMRMCGFRPEYFATWAAFR